MPPDVLVAGQVRHFLLEVLGIQQLVAFRKFTGCSYKVSAVICVDSRRETMPSNKPCQSCLSDAVERSLQSSRCIHFVAKHTKRQTYDLRRVGFPGLPLLVVKGPAKSIPVTENGGEGLILVSGS